MVVDTVVAAVVLLALGVSWRRSSPRAFSRREASRHHSLRNRHHKITTAVRSRVKATDRPQGAAVSLARSWAASRACSAAAAAAASPTVR